MITIERTDTGRILVGLPSGDIRNPDVIVKARALDGRQTRNFSKWSFDSRDEDRVKSLLREVYGTDVEMITGPFGTH